MLRAKLCMVCTPVIPPSQNNNNAPFSRLEVDDRVMSTRTTLIFTDTLPDFKITQFVNLSVL